MTDSRAKERVGSVLHDKWTLEHLIGEGGMGAVYAARHRNGARAAVKVLSPEGARVPHIRKRFLKEGLAANRVDHPGAVKVLDDDVISEGPDEGTAYLVMELLEGESLQARAARDPPLNERDLLELANEVLAVLETAHANGVVHRDLKPDNLFLAKESEGKGTQIKVLDFGLARLLEAAEQTIQGMALGTATYMSPEQAAGHVGEIDGRTDIYALGSILFQLRSNQRIHDAGHTLGLVIRMATTPAPKLRTVAPDVSEPFARIVDRALEFRREDRYLSAAVMRADVKAALELLRTIEASTLNVLTSTTTLEAADTVAGQPAPAAMMVTTTANALPKAQAAQAEEREASSTRDPSKAAVVPDPPLPLEKIEEPPPTIKKRRTKPEREPKGLPMRAFLFFAVVTIATLVVWRNWASIQRIVGPAPVSTSTTTASQDDASSSITQSSADLDAAGDAQNTSAGFATDAAVDELADASSGDGGDDDDDDDDDDLDGAAGDASAPAASSGGPHHRTVKTTRGPQRRKTGPKRPGHRRRRWHW